MNAMCPSCKQSLGEFEHHHCDGRVFVPYDQAIKLINPCSIADEEKNNLFIQELKILLDRYDARLVSDEEGMYVQFRKHSPNKTILCPPDRFSDCHVYSPAQDLAHFDNDY